MPIKLDVTQYKARPLGSVNEKNAIIKGINQSIIIWLPDCRGSVDGCMVIFCWTQVDAKTRTGMMMFVGSDAVTWMVKTKMASSRSRAVDLGRTP